MAVSPRCPSLYRKPRLAVTLAMAVLILTQTVLAQFTPARKKASKGPRALGLLQLAANGTAHLVPITILIDGNFYDAGAYKASPIPMALESQTVYEALRSGVSQGLFTVTVVRQLKDSWIADGTWLPAGATPPRTAHKAETKPNMGADEGPPVLRRPGAEKKPAGSQPPSSAPTPDSKPPAPTTPAPASAPPPPATSSSSSPAPAPPEDTDRPVLRRGVPPAAALSKQTPPATPAVPKASENKSPSTPPAASPSSSKKPMQLIPAISDADGPDPQPYLYAAKSEEEQNFRKKMLALAADEILAKVKTYGGIEELPAPAATRPRKGTSVKPTQPVFDDVQLKIFDLSSTNEPILILTATAHMPNSAKGAPSPAADTQYFITLVTRDDIYGDLHKAFANVTDNHHLDVIPRMELVDAVDADGDGRGELLFRKVSDTGNAYNIYRQIGDQLWPLFEGTLP